MGAGEGGMRSAECKLTAKLTMSGIKEPAGAGVSKLQRSLKNVCHSRSSRRTLSSAASDMG